MKEIDAVPVEVGRLLAAPDRARDVPLEQVRALLMRIAAQQVRLAAVQNLLAARLIDSGASPTDGKDHLESVEEAATRLGTTVDWLYHHARELPFTVRIGRQLRFSSHGIEQYIKRRRGSG